MNLTLYLQQRLVLLKNRSFLFLMCNALLAPLGNSLVYISLTWHSQEEHASVGKAMLTMLCLWGPSVFLSPFVGYLVDRFNPKYLAFISDFSRGLLSASSA